MVAIRHGKGSNPLRGFQVDPAAVRFVGHDLQRPECILAERDGTLWAADARGGVMQIRPDGTQQLIAQTQEAHFDMAADAHDSLTAGTLPNGLAFAANGDILISNFGTDRLERMTRTGASSVIADSIDGKPLGKVNFVLRDSQGRIWLTISTMVNPWTDATRTGLRDGYIALYDGKGLRVVAEGFAFTNEIRLDAAEEWLYVAETTAKCVSRLRVGKDGALSGREVYGPSNLGTGLIDGIAFDSFGNLWGTMIMADRLVAITPEGDVLEILDAGGDATALAAMEAEFASGQVVNFDTMMRCGGTLAPWMASVTFGGADLQQVYLGSLRGTRIPTFRAPVAGLPMVHW